MNQYAEITRTKLSDDRFRTLLEKQANVAAMFAKVWPPTSPEQALRRLLGDAQVVRAAAFGVLTSSEQMAIIRPQAKRVADEPWSAEDLVCLEELRCLLSGDEPQRYRHIVVDEAQDLTPMQARSLARRCPSGSMTVLGDLAHTPGSASTTCGGRLADVLAGSDGWNMAELATGYRVPTEVMEFAAPLGASVSPSTAIPLSVRPPSSDALSVVAVSRSQLVTEAVSRALRLASKDGEQARSVAVIIPDDDAFVDEINREVVTAQDPTLPGIDRQITAPGPARLAKGLEYDHVVVLEPQQLADQDPAALQAALRRSHALYSDADRTAFGSSSSGAGRADQTGSGREGCGDRYHAGPCCRDERGAVRRS